MLTLVDKVFRLHRIRLFDSLPTADLQALANIAEVAAFAPGERILTEGEPGDRLYILVEGRVAVFTQREGVRTDLATLDEGAVFGELAILTEEARSASIEAVTACQCLAIAREPFRALIEDRPEIAFGVFEAIAKRLRQTDETIARLTREVR